MEIINRSEYPVLSHERAWQLYILLSEHSDFRRCSMDLYHYTYESVPMLGCEQFKITVIGPINSLWEIIWFDATTVSITLERLVEQVPETILDFILFNLDLLRDKNF